MFSTHACILCMCAYLCMCVCASTGTGIEEEGTLEQRIGGLKQMLRDSQFTPHTMGASTSHRHMPKGI